MKIPSSLVFLTYAAVSTQAFIPAQQIAASTASPLLFATPAAGADIEQSQRGKVNEIDFCIAPADASLSRSESSLTRFLNNASNRAIRRILLARSWPSAEALNLSLRQVLSSPVNTEDIPTSTVKCPVPRPILNILTRRRDSSGEVPSPRSRSDEEYVQDQIQNFREQYGDDPGLDLAEGYLECVLSLATSGTESTRVEEVLSAGVYDESYRRIIGVLQRVGVQWEVLEDGRRKIAPKLLDQDICLSMMDKLTLKREQATPNEEVAEGIAEEEAVSEEIKATVKPEKSIPLRFWRKNEETKEEIGEEIELNSEDLGGVLLSAEEPSMTRQLNALSNIVQRALLFGGDQELLVLSETLDADKPGFIQRWYPSDTIEMTSPEEEQRPGVQYLNCLVLLLKECYENRMAGLDPPLSLLASYMNAYERLTATLVELGSGYIKPISKSLPLPRTAQEELGRFAVWETNFRQSGGNSDVAAFPEDLEGIWQVQDEVGGETIGVANVVFQAQGQVQVDQPMKGLRWRLDPGPTHLDTCTFQVLGDDGTVLQYRGFIDRGARLESRFSKRPIRIRGSVMFQMRDESDGYWKDMLPINYRTGTTKFVMTKQVSGN